ncbi:MAG: phosphatidylglycerophosphatase A [FCB group bacterium]|nr:phosphatidylglycerophosphatase A [FCB group bacterium]
MNNFTRLFTTFFFIGYLPIAPGTFGSLAAAAVWWFIPASNIFLQVFLILFVIVAGTFFSGKESRRTAEKDPGRIVIDEVAGMWLTLLIIPRELSLFILGFLLFRLLDIAKPWIIDRVQSLEGGLGIMADDVLAGFISWVVLLTFIQLS